MPPAVDRRAQRRDLSAVPGGAGLGSVSPQFPHDSISIDGKPQAIMHEVGRRIERLRGLRTQKIRFRPRTKQLCELFTSPVSVADAGGGPMPAPT